MAKLDQMKQALRREEDRFNDGEYIYFDEVLVDVEEIDDVLHDISKEEAFELVRWIRSEYDNVKVHYSGSDDHRHISTGSSYYIAYSKNNE